MIYTTGVRTHPRKRTGMRIGIDLGGTKTEVIALADDGAERFRRRVSTPRDYRGKL